MAGNKKPRKAYVAKPRIRPIVFGIPQDDAVKLQLIPHQCLDDLVAGKNTEQAFHTIACRLNIGLTLANSLYSDSAVEVMQCAVNAIRAVSERFKRVGKYGVTSDEAVSIGDGLVLTDDMQRNSTRREIRDAQRHVFKVAAV